MHQIAPTPRQKRLFAPLSVTTSLVADGDKRTLGVLRREGREGDDAIARGVRLIAHVTPPGQIGSSRLWIGVEKGL